MNPWTIVGWCVVAGFALPVLAVVCGTVYVALRRLFVRSARVHVGKSRPGLRVVK